MNLVVNIQISLFVNYSFILYILQFCSVNVFTVFLYFFTKLFWQPQLPELFCKNYVFSFIAYRLGKVTNYRLQVTLFKM